MVVFFWDQPFLVGWVGFFCLFYWEKIVFALVDPLFQTTQNLVEMAENDG